MGLRENIKFSSLNHVFEVTSSVSPDQSHPINLLRGNHSEFVRAYPLSPNPADGLRIPAHYWLFHCWTWLLKLRVKGQIGDKVSFPGFGSRNVTPRFHLADRRKKLSTSIFPCVHSDALVIKHQKHAEKYFKGHDKHGIFRKIMEIRPEGVPQIQRI